MRPKDMKTKIFLDGGNPEETREISGLLGFLDGQTTNPSLVAKHPRFQSCIKDGSKCSEEDAWAMYRDIATEISPLVSDGSVSVEVYADRNTTAEEMIDKALELNEWIPNAHIKLPITQAGLQAAEALTARGIRVNMTLCFSQEQAAAVYAATRGARRGDVFVSPFIGRLDDRGENGMSLIRNILRMFSDSDGHVEVLAASVRNMDHLNLSLQIRADIVTAPAKILREWQEKGMSVPEMAELPALKGLQDIVYEELDLTKPWSEFNITHELTDKGIERFVDDWKALVDMKRI